MAFDADKSPSLPFLHNSWLKKLFFPAIAGSIIASYFLSQPPSSEKLMDHITSYRDVIIKKSEQHDLPPAFVACALYNEMSRVSSFGKLRDWSASFLGYDASIGDGQLRISTAMGMDNKSHNATREEKLIYRSALLDSEKNLGLVAKHLRHLLNRKNRTPNISSGDLEKNPHLMAVTYTEYAYSPSRNPLETAVPSRDGISLLHCLTDESAIPPLFIADRPRRDALDDIIRSYIRSNDGPIQDFLKNSKIPSNGLTQPYLFF